MKKRSILYYLLIILPFLIAIGFSTWVIIYEFSFGPNKQESTLSSYFGTEQEGTFCNEELYPVQKNGDPIKESRLSYQYKAYGADDSTYDAGGPIDAGVYNIKITVASEDGTSSEECVIKYTVKPRKVTSKIAEMDYSSTYGNYTDFVNNKRNYLKFYGEDGSVDKFFTDSSYDILAMHNGYYYYGDLDSIKDYDTNLLVEPEVADTLVGSTYLLQLELNSENFLVKDCISNEYTLTPRIMFKYKTVYATINGIANTLVTIEDAITNSSSDVVLMGIDSDDNNFIETSFSKILPTNTYSLSGKRKLKLLYATNSGDFDRNYRSKITGLYSCLMIPNGITINLEENSESQIIIGAMLVPNGSVARHSVIINHGEINVNSSCFVGAYGFLKGTGLINVKSGGEVMDVFKIYDWPGADEALNLTKANAFPVKEWSVCNISCRTRIYNGGLYNSVSNILVLSIVELKIDDIFIIGTSETDNCLFKPSASSSSLDYIEKSAYIPNDSYTATNQSKTIQNSVYVKGNYIDDNVKVNARGYPFETSTSCAIPLSYYDITIMDNSKLEISAASYIFMNSSSKISVMENAEIQINGNAYIAMLNGSAINMEKQGSTLSGVGTFAGKINCNAEKSVLSISNYDVLKDENRIILKTSSTASASYECLSSGNIKVNNEYKTEQSFEDSFLYISEEKNGAFYYAGASEDEYTSYKIIYHTNGGETLSNDIIPSFDSTYEVTKSMLKTPYKKYYALKNWHTSESFTDENIFNSIILDSSNSTLNIYAEWEYKKYEFVYVVAYENPETNEPIILNNEDILTDVYNTKFTYETLLNGQINITTNATYEGKTFYGWYVGTDDNGPLINKSFKLSYLDELLEKNDVDQIPLYGVFKDYKEYTINFIDQTSKYSFNAKSNVIDGDSIEWPGLDFYKNQETQHYCEGWYFDENYSSASSYYDKFDESIFSRFANDKNEINVYGNFIEKRSITYKNDDEILITKYYLSESEIKELGVPAFSQSVKYSLPDLEGYSCPDWIDKSTEKTYLPDEITISTFEQKNIILHVNKTPIPYTLTINNSNAKVTVDNVTKTGTIIVYVYNTVVISVTGKSGGLFSAGASVSATINYNGTSSTITGEGGSAFFGDGKTASKTITNITGDITIS